MQRISNYFWPAPSVPPPSAEAQKKRAAIHEFLDYGQSGVLLIGGALFCWNGTTSFTLGTIALGCYLEILAASFYEKVKHDPVTAQYIATNCSIVTKYCTMFNTVAQPMVQQVIDKSIKPLIVKIDELITVPSEAPKNN